ncbi:Cytochrome c, mono-and diheme variants [Pseudidiomarina maritima]|jgi:mono/diheme cytochrome c family protein|uniref:Cytochrome c, mono-and diheme variants n=1 Tax=Pseudidiomarina maritima TaxID=519453 RepID=A0A1I6I2P1_9GAMM|nr:cytochrome c [Pseudidiomarina maritima]SFR60929.1 Cytochrome c, mono-and diheme variants [Pseudidiomarina maritima]
MTNVNKFKSGIFAAVSIFALFSAGAQADAGEAVYKKNCMACHQANGQGMAAVFPPLVGNSNIADKPAYIAETIVKGKSGKVTVNGAEFNGMMPPMAYLSDADIAAVVSYVNKHFAGGSKEISATEVKAVR